MDCERSEIRVETDASDIAIGDIDLIGFEMEVVDVGMSSRLTVSDAVEDTSSDIAAIGDKEAVCETERVIERAPGLRVRQGQTERIGAERRH